MTSYLKLKTSLLDDLLLIANETQLTGIYFMDCAHAPVLPSDWKLNPRHAVLQQASEELQEYFEGTRTSFSISLHYKGTDFQERVWQEIAKIPFGQTITYSELARRAGIPDAIRAAGTATGKNPLGIIIPCHRVVGKNGSFGGYAGGLGRKRRLLDLEQRDQNLDL